MANMHNHKKKVYVFFLFHVITYTSTKQNSITIHGGNTPIKCCQLSLVIENNNMKCISIAITKKENWSTWA